MGKRAILLGVVVSAAVIGVGGCEEVEQVRDRWRAETPHEAYLQGLHDAGLATTALSRAWIEEAAGAVRDPRPVDLPFQEEGFIAPETPGAVGYRFRLERGQVLTVELDVESDEATRVFMELFRLAEDPEDAPRPVLNSDATSDGLVYEPTRAGDFVVRVQPELLRGGRFRISLGMSLALAFPVSGRTPSAILSFFGAERDAGRRQHHGVDIFAPRGTPVLASSDGSVSRANLTTIGGKVVWLRDQRGRNVYYAHLDSQAVSRGDRVQAGDTVGFVGNTGNARTTPPHLHFGIYVRGEGPVDPMPYLRLPSGEMPALLADASILGEQVRSRDEGIRFRDGASRSSEVVGELERYTPLRVLGGSAEWFRVALPDGRAGYVAARLTEPVDAPVASTVAQGDRPVTARPASNAPVVEVVPAGTEVPVLGAYEGFLLVQAPSGRRAWVEAAAADQDG